MISTATYEPTYTTHTTFVVSNKSIAGASDISGLTLSDISASNALTNTFKYILLSDEALNAVIKTYNLTMSSDRLKSCISISPIANTNVLEMTVVTKNAELSQQIASKIIEYYPGVLERTLKFASLEVLNSPSRALEADIYYGVITFPALGFLLAVFAVIVYVYLKQVLRETVRTVSDIGARLGLTVLAAIPRVKFPANKKTGLLITDKANGFAFMESYKALRTKIESTTDKKGYKTYIVTSTLECEGKTTAAVNLSAALAANGRKVLLIDADLRSPSVFNFLGLPVVPPVSGLDSVLRGETAVETAIIFDKHLGFSVLPHFSEVLDSSELLSSFQMKNLIARVTHQYDFIIIDTPPAGILTDAAVITAYADAVLLVLRQDYTPVRAIDSAATSLSENKAELIGCVFSIVDGRGTRPVGAGYSKYQKYDKYTKHRGGGLQQPDAFRRSSGR